MHPVIASLVGLAAFATAHPAHDQIFGRQNNVRCRSEPTEDFVAASFGLEKRGSIINRDIATNQTKLLLDAYFHVVTATADEISDEQLQKQIQVLNENFAPHDIQFNLRGIDKTINATWANDEYNYDMMRKLHKGDYKTLNLYFLTKLYGGGLGACTFPMNNTLPTFEEYGRPMDGCKLDAQTVPGGTKRNANLGKTATHEVGHWFGLYHTFYGGCTYGDGVADTPAQAEAGSPEVGCEKPIDSCPDQPGLDPMFNYMDYSGDACYREFTPGQKARMLENFYAYRAYV